MICNPAASPGGQHERAEERSVTCTGDRSGYEGLEEENYSINVV